METEPQWLQLARNGWSADVLVDPANRRLDVKRYRIEPAETRPDEAASESESVGGAPERAAGEYAHDERVADLCATLRATGREYELGKVIVRVRPADWRGFLAAGFALEGLIDGYFAGTADGYYMSYFLDPRRQVSHHAEEEQLILEQACAVEPTSAPDLAPGYELLAGTPDLAAQMAELFGRVFVTYPTPLSDPNYLKDQMESRRAFYRLVRYGSRLVSAMSAEVDWATKSAEMTDCATLSEYRGRGLIRMQLEALAQEMEWHGIPTVYSIARARSRGMNVACRRAGYVFRGRLVQNCNIMGSMEDMNVWVRERDARTLM